jgi:hypothetical protein
MFIITESENKTILYRDILIRFWDMGAIHNAMELAPLSGNAFAGNPHFKRTREWALCSWWPA